MLLSEIFNVRGNAVFITGGASGIGLAIAKVMLANGAAVTLFDRATERLAAAAEELSVSDVPVLTIVGDATNDAAMRSAVAQSVVHHGRLDSAFLNAGISGGPGIVNIHRQRNPLGSIDAIEPAFWHNNISVNLTSVLIGLRAVLGPMRQQRGGSIVVTTSVAAVRSEEYVGTPYMVAKAGVAQLVRQSAAQLARDGIRINAIAPGAFTTDIGGGRLAIAEVNARFASANLMNRVADVSEIMGLALLLASPASRLMTGEQYLIDGGAAVGSAEGVI